MHILQANIKFICTSFINRKKPFWHDLQRDKFYIDQQCVYIVFFLQCLKVQNKYKII